MKNEIMYIPFKSVFDELLNIAKEEGFSNQETIKWIVVKVLRLKREEFDKITKVDTESVDRMVSSLHRLIKGESLSKIFGFVEFYGNFFNVTENVFDPRLSTECLVKVVLQSQNVQQEKPKVIDLCTGSGCVAITISKMLGKPVDAVDISPLAIEVAQENNDKIGGQVRFVQMDLNRDWNEALDEKYDVIVSNPPYWDSKKILEKPDVVKDNPREGFDGGEDGLHYIRLIVENAKLFLKNGGKLFLEMEPDQEDNIRKMLDEDFVDIQTYKDYRQITRVISAEYKE